MPKNNKKHNDSKQSLMIAIGAVSVLLVVLVALTLILLNKQPDGDGADVSQSNQTTTPTNPSEPGESGADVDQKPSGDSQPSGGSQAPTGNIPTESNPMVLDQGLYVVHMGNYSGRFVEDGSDVQAENFCAAVVENRSSKTLQLLQFTITGEDQVYDFQLTTLPPGERAIVQDLNRTPFVAGNEIMTAEVALCVFFADEPSLHEDVFAVSGTENGLEIRNLTDEKIAGPIYVYYKTRTAEGYVGGITYRLTIPALDAKETYNAAVNHFWPGSSQVMFIDYAH